MSGPDTWLLVSLVRIFFFLWKKSLPTRFAIVALGLRLRVNPILSLEAGVV